MGLYFMNGNHILYCKCNCTDILVHGTTTPLPRQYTTTNISVEVPPSVYGRKIFTRVIGKNNNNIGGHTTYTVGGSLLSPPSAVRRIDASAKEVPGLHRSALHTMDY